MSTAILTTSCSSAASVVPATREAPRAGLEVAVDCCGCGRESGRVEAGVGRGCAVGVGGKVGGVNG